MILYVSPRRWKICFNETSLWCAGKHQTEGNSFGDAAFEVPFCFGSNCIFQQLFQTARTKCTKLYASCEVLASLSLSFCADSIKRFHFHTLKTEFIFSVSARWCADIPGIQPNHNYRTFLRVWLRNKHVIFQDAAWQARFFIIIFPQHSQHLCQTTLLFQTSNAWHT